MIPNMTVKELREALERINDQDLYVLVEDDLAMDKYPVIGVSYELTPESVVVLSIGEEWTKGDNP